MRVVFDALYALSADLADNFNRHNIRIKHLLYIINAIV